MSARGWVAVVPAVLAAATAHADPKPTKPKPVDAASVADKLEVYRDEAGQYYVSPKANAFGDQTNQWVFYGDGKSMYRQRVVGYGLTDGRYSWTLWSPRARQLTHAGLVLDGDKPYVECRRSDDGRKMLTQLTANEAKALFQRATFLPELWQRQVRLVARNEDGVYYLVDQLREDYGGRGFRVFVGQKGAMKELPMTNVVSDTAGDIYATKAGELKIIAEAGNKAYWKKGKTKEELVVLDPFDNRYMIYRELGIYGQLGVVCDEQ
ncbi:MAG: hypothetical protein ACTHU0_14400 [Kofleriaceae bacterium]